MKYFILLMSMIVTTEFHASASTSEKNLSTELDKGQSSLPAEANRSANVAAQGLLREQLELELKRCIKSGAIQAPKNEQEHELALQKITQRSEQEQQLAEVFEADEEEWNKVYRSLGITVPPLKK
jgi:hypothetical protein